MPRTYTWQHTVFNYETDAWGQLHSSVILRLLERTATLGATAGGFGREFYEEQGTAWIIRRMTMLLPAIAHSNDDLEISTWASHFVRVRGGREYRIRNLTTGEQVVQGLAEWVYINRATGAPQPIPTQIGVQFDVPGAPLGNYERPVIASLDSPRQFASWRRAEWYESNSMGHVNNAVYADWLDAALHEMLDRAGRPTSRLKSDGYQLRPEYLFLDYKSSAVPGDSLEITTSLLGVEGRRCSVNYSIVRTADLSEVVKADYVYGWATTEGTPCDPPPGLQL